jgi:hypothetical protein
LLLGHGIPRGVATRHYKRVVQPLVDAALADDALSAGLADLDDARPDGWVHGMRVSLLAVSIGRQLGLDRAALAELGVAALLFACPRGGAEGGVEPERQGQRGSSTSLGLARLAPLDPATLAALHAALAFGDTVRGPGAIAAPAPSIPSSVGIVGIADAYVATAVRRSGGAPRWTPYEALGLVLGPLAPHFHPALRAALIRAIGVYPPGQIVELDDGTVARVCAADPADPERPILELLTGPAGARGAAAGRGAVLSMPAGRCVKRAVPFAHGAGDGARVRAA